MGVLDEAIRAHLELKRKHGAAEAELTKQEQEALGPARRTPAEASAEQTAPELADGEAVAEPEPPAQQAEVQYEPEAATEIVSSPSVEPEPEVLVEPEPEPVVEQDPEPLPEPDPPVESEPPVEPEQFVEPDPVAPEPAELEPEPAPEEPASTVVDEPAPESPVQGDTPPRGFDRVDEPAPSGEEGEDEDVLEETPDFLQETPEHDRLWFEQKPPRDFDFDE